MIRAYTAQFSITIKEDFQNFLSDVFPSSFTTLAHIAVVLLLYNAVDQPLYYGVFNWSMIAWYLIITQVILSAGTDVIRLVNEHIQNGMIVNALSKPYAYPLSLYATFLGSIITESLGALLLAVPLGLLIADVPFTLLSVSLGLILIFFAITMNFLIAFCIGLIAFWTEDANPYSWIYGKFIFIFGGLLFPLDIFPPAIQSIIKLFPPAFLLYYPTKTIVLFNWGDFWYALGMQLLYIAVFSLLAYIFYKKAVRKVNINGG